MFGVFMLLGLNVVSGRNMLCAKRTQNSLGGLEKIGNCRLSLRQTPLDCAQGKQDCATADLSAAADCTARGGRLPTTGHPSVAGVRRGRGDTPPEMAAPASAAPVAATLTDLADVIESSGSPLRVWA